MALESAQPESGHSTAIEREDDKDWHDFACGAGAAMANIILTFPAYKVMFRQQLDGLRFRKAAKQVIHEGLSNLYRGVGPPLMQKGASLSIMFGAYHKFQRIFSKSLPSVPREITNASAAILAGSVEATLTPFERVQVLLQQRKYNERFNNTFHTFSVIRIQYGLKEFYRGLTPILLRNGPSNALFFGLRGRIKASLPEPSSPVVNSLHDFLSGAVLGACLSTLFFPFNVVKNNMQKQLGGEFISCWRSFIIVFNERGRSFKRMYYGVSLNYTRALISWGIINCAYEILMKIITELDP